MVLLATKYEYHSCKLRQRLGMADRPDSDPDPVLTTLSTDKQLGIAVATEIHELVAYLCRRATEAGGGRVVGTELCSALLVSAARLDDEDLLHSLYRYRRTSLRELERLLSRR